MGYKEEIEQVKKQRSATRSKFTRKVNLLREGIERGNPTVVLHTSYDQVSQAYSEVETLHGKYVELLYSGENNDTLLKEADEYISVLEKNRTDIQVLLEKHIDSNKNVPTRVKVKALAPPTFSGDIREYPNFKTDYERLMKHDFGKDPFALKQCLSGEALKAVKGAEDNYDVMFQRLDEKYGKSRRIVDVIMSDLKSLKPVAEGDTKGFVKLVETVERSWLDLKKMKLESEMDSTNIVSLIERVLPNTQKREWVLLADESNTTTSMFNQLLEFLLKEKRVLEYMDSTIRCSDSHRSSKANVNSAVTDRNEGVRDVDNSATLINVIEKLQSNQSRIEQCLVNLTRAVSDMSASKREWKPKEKNECRDWCWFHGSGNHSILDCITFHNLSNPEKIEVMRNNGICYNCMQGRHIARHCGLNRTCNVMDNDQRCGRYHHPSLHAAHVEGIMFHNTVAVKKTPTSKPKVLLMISKVTSKGQSVNTLWDPGSDITLITHKMASSLGLSGRNISLMVTKVGNRVENYDSKEYTLPLSDKEGRIWTITAYGMNEITSNVREVDVSGVAYLLDDVSVDELARPVGTVDLLIGADCCNLLPQVVKTVGNLQLMKNQFGFCLRGTHPSLTGNTNNSSNTCIRVHHLAGTTYPNEIVTENTETLKQSLDKFFDVEGLDTDCIPKCDTCKYSQAVTGPSYYTIKEVRELELIEKGLKYDEINQQWTAEYPWLRDPATLPNNLPVAVARMKSTEKRLIKLGPEYTKLYQGQMQDMTDRQVARKLTPEEMRSYDGPIHYIHHHEVMKPESKSTPVRIVFNSSASYMGHTLNDYWAKGPDVLNSLLAVLMRFRQEQVAVVADISKMYNTIKLGKIEQHTHRFVWRDMDVRKTPDHYVLTAVPFGDRPSGIISMLALRHTAEMCLTKFPDAASMIIKNSYVDDIVHSVADHTQAYNIIRNAEEILSVGGFKIKHWIVSGQNGKCDAMNILNIDNEKILGLSWDPKNDHFKFSIKVNFSTKIKKVHTEPNVEKDEIARKLPVILTRRMVLSQAASIYDPLGLVTPFTLRAKVLMRELVTQNKIKEGKVQSVDWDEPIPPNIREKWKDFFIDLYQLESLTFKRCIKPPLSVGEPVLVMFSDGSNQAYGACAYVRWALQSGKFEVSLIAAKNRIAPVKQTTIPRIELCGAVTSCRLRELIQKVFDWKFSLVFHIVDSAIVRAQIQKESHGFKTFVGTRIAEIQTKTDPSEWWWVPSECNPADLLTRPNYPSSLTSTSVWQTGPEYLSQPIETWPISQCCNDDLPDKIGITMNCSIRKDETINLSIIDVSRYSSYNKLLRVTGRLLAASRGKSLREICKAPTATLLKEVEVMWVREVQKSLSLNWHTKYQRLGPTLNSEGVITVGQRIAKWLKDNWSKDCYALLPVEHPFTRLYVKHLHDIDHAGIEVTLAKIQNKYWIPGARKLIKSIRGRCVKCRRWSGKVEGQRMGEVISERLQPSPPFHHVGIDLFGPFKIKDTVKRRTTGKAYGVVFNCLVSRAVYVDLADGYGTHNFLATFRRFVSLRGYPGTVHSDNGPQLVAANKELKRMMSTWNFTEIMNFGSNEGMTWSFNKSADAPWQSGCSESLIKLIKRSLTMLIGDSSLIFSELQTVMFEVANLLNERPIGIKPGTDINLGRYLCPNDLILGRATIKAPSGPWTNCLDPKFRLDFVERIIDGFWKKWQRDYFPTLLVRQKWHVETRNVRSGDIVLLQDANSIRGKWKLAQVTIAEPGRDGRVRDVTIRYKLQEPGSAYQGQYYTEVKRSVHKLVVLLPKEEQE